MRNKTFLVFVVTFLFIFSLKVSASELCSPNGYTILTINGVFTNEKGAQENKRALEDHFLPTHNNEKLTVDFLYNPTHLAGASDLIDAVVQGAFNEKTDYDLTNMLTDASQKVTTQKLLLVAHSQGNFYANNFYDKVASQEGGVPKESIGVYGVASPANRVAGGGKYLTSDTDGVIAATVARFIKILTPNIHIPLQDSDGNGHSFSDVYLKYQGNRIVSDIKLSLNNLQKNEEQDTAEPCISAPKLTALHKIKSVAFAIADPTAVAVKTGVVGTYNAGVFVANGVSSAVAVIGNGIQKTGLAIGNMFSGLMASAINSLPNTNNVTTTQNISETINIETTATLPQPQDKILTQQEIVNSIPVPEIITTTENVPLDINPIPTLETILIKTEDLPNSDSETINTTTEKPSITNSINSYGGGGSSPTADTTAPVISIVGANPSDVIKGNIYVDLGATALDEKDGSTTVVTTGIVDTATIGTYTIIYTTTDISGNIATVNRIVNVIDPTIPDATAPVITITGANPLSLEKDTTYTELGATATDNIDVTVDVIPSGSVDEKTVGAYTITYTATDVAGNISTLTRIVNVVDSTIPDTTPPVILITGANPIDVIKGTAYTDQGATANDETDGVIIVDTTGSVDIATIGTYIITYTATDLAKNISTLTRTVNVVADTGAPVISLNGNATEVVVKNSVYTDPGATATDAVDGILTVSKTGSVNTAVQGKYIITYKATDVSGNIATKTRTVIVDVGAKLDNPSSVFVSGNYAYVLSSDFDSMEIVDVSNPALLVHKSSVSGGVDGIVMSAPKSIYVSGNYAYVVSYSNALEIIDVSNPSLPVHKTTFRSGDTGSNFTNPNFITISGNYAYIVGYASQNVNILDISNPISPIYKSSYAIGSTTSISSVFVRNNYMYVIYSTVGSNNGGLNIIDVSSPSMPLFKGRILHGTGGSSISNPQSIYVSGNYAYIINTGDNSFEIIDISNPEVPIHSALIKDEDNGASLYVPVSVVVSGNYAYIVSYNGSTLEVIDVFNPISPIHKATLPNNITGASLYYATQIFISGSYAYVTPFLNDALEIVDISDPLTPFHAGKIFKNEFTHATVSTTLSSEKKFTSFKFTNLTPNVIGAIDETNHTISLSVPNGTNVISISPSFQVSINSVTIPSLGKSRDFTNPINYLVYAEDGSTQNYLVTVTILPLADATPPVISSLSLSPSPIVGYAKIGDVITLTITADSAGYTAKDIKINNVAAAGFTDNGGGTYSATYTVSSSDNDVMSGTIPVSVVLSDATGNSNVAYTTVVANALRIDAHVPTLVSAKVTTSTTIDVTFSEDIDGGTVNSSGNEFTVSGHKVSEAHELEGVVTLTLETEILPAETPSVTFESALFRDLAGNQATSPTTVTATNI